MTKIAYHLIIKGRVQGVSYRNWTRRTANEIGIKGWVKNLDNGDVEAVFEGPVDDVNKLIEACYNGPEMARVDFIEKKMLELNHFNDFKVLY